MTPSQQTVFGQFYGWVLAVVGVIAIVTGIAFTITSVHSSKLAARACHRSIQFGPYLADLYAKDLNPGPGVFRVMPPSAARAYRDSIPKHC